MREESHYYSDSLQKINRNTFWLFSGESFNKMAVLLVIILITRYLGVERYGEFSFALSFLILFLSKNNLKS